MTSYKYTLDTGVLNIFQRKFYEVNGYIVFQKLIPQDILDECSQRFDDIVAGTAPRAGMTVMHDVKDRKSVNKLQDINNDPVFQKYLKYEKMLNVVESFTGSNIMAMHSMLIAKPPDVGFGTSVHPPHQDLYYFPFRPEDKIVAAWTAIEKCDVENGCLFVSPGSHQLGKLFPHEYPPGKTPGTFNKFYHGILNVPESTKWLNLEMNPGDTVFFHPMLIHGSGVNVSKRTRKAISCHYAAAECRYIDVNNTVQQSIQDEILDMLSKQYPGVEIKYQEIWQIKSDLVRGVRSNL